MWLQYTWSDEHGSYRSSAYKDALLSSRFVPLGSQLSMLIAEDREWLAKIPERDRNTDPDDPWVWSPILGCLTPSSGIRTANLAWESSEVLARFVPPSAIKVL
jgi:hypothetical protein